MKANLNEPGTIAFSPGLQKVDPGAAYWMNQVALRLRREICWAWHQRGLLPGLDAGGLPPMMDKASASLAMARHWDEKKRFFGADPTAAYLTGQLEEEQRKEEQRKEEQRKEIMQRKEMQRMAKEKGNPGLSTERPAPGGSFGWVLEKLNLDPTASFVLALGLLPAFDSAAGSVMAACLNDPAMTYPTPALAQMLWDEPEEVLTLADPFHPLFRYGLLHPIGCGSSLSSGIDWNGPIRVPALVANRLLFPDSPLARALAPVTVDGKEEAVVTESSHLLASRLNSGDGDTLALVPILGPGGSAHVEVVRGLARLANRKVVELKWVPDLSENSRFLDAIAALCWLKGVDLFLGREVTALLDRDKQVSPFSALRFIPINIFLGITGREQLNPIPPDLLLPMVEVPVFSHGQRINHWKSRLGAGARGLEGVIEECARRFRYEKETINGICAGLGKLSGQVSEKDFIDACRAEMNLDMGDLAQRVKPRFEDEELILPYKENLQFREIIKAMNGLTRVHYEWGTARAWNESGISVLFSGPPGTGKTMAAEVLAGRLNLPMFRIDLSQVVNKYIGETEKNLKKVFDTADVSDMILFFDEADALFGRRTEVKDAHDRYANLEISYMLERMERFKGMAILATNRKKDLDPAFMRRLRFIVDFPLPGLEQRRAIWRQVIPGALDGSGIDLDFLARQFPLAGGHIRSIVFNACLQGADGEMRLTMERIIVAVKREYDKINRSVSLEHFGPYADLVRRIEHEDARHQD
ncbi:MAG: ATP-binding protein [Desulfobacteraceae bacterium]|nr:ATP-binding protein [Desulfobacteraceae bacterium]